MRLRSRQAAKSARASLDFDPTAPDGFMWFMAAMCWPHDRRRQQQAVASWHLDCMAHAKDVAPRVAQMGAESARAAFADDMGLDAESMQFAPWTAAAVAQMANPEDAYRAAAAGLRALPAWEKAAADAPGVDRLVAAVADASQRGACLAGHMLVLVATLARHHPEVEPSIGRARAILAEAKRRNPSSPIPDTHTLKRNWKDWRCVAPLWAADLVVSNYRAEMAPGLPLDIAATEVLLNPAARLGILQMAAWFSDFGIHLTPQNARDPLLSDEECPAMPAGTEVMEPPLEPLADWGVAAVRGASSGGNYRWNTLEWD